MKSIVFLILFMGSAFAQSPDQVDVKAASRAWAAFQCGRIAMWGDDFAESKRLTKLGMEQGSIFLRSVQGISEPASIRDVPLDIGERLDPLSSPEFTLGRIFEAAILGAKQEMDMPRFDFDLTEEEKGKARREFSKRNCPLL